MTKGVGSTGGSLAKTPDSGWRPALPGKPMKSPCAIIGAACFLEQSSEALVAPDAAIAALEEMAVALQAATFEGCIHHPCQSEAIRLRVAH